MTLTIAGAMAYGHPPHVALAVSSSPAILGSLVVWRVHPDGSRYRVIVERGNDVIAGSWSGVDYHAPCNAVVTYVAESGGLSSEPSVEMFVPSDLFWMLHAAVPDMSICVTKWALDPFELTYPSRATRFDVLGRARPVYQSNSSGRGPEQAAISVRCDTPEDRAAVRRLVEDDGPILLNSPLEEIGWKWVQPMDLKIRNPATFTQFPVRWADIPYVECEQPDADLAPTWTIGDLTAEGLTVGQVDSTFADIGHLTYNVRS